MSKHTLSGTKRTIVGKKVKVIRSQGLLPATVYGKNTKPVTISITLLDFQKLYREAGETGLIELSIENQVHPVLIHRVQLHPVSRAILHVELHEVDLKEKVHAEIPVECEGEPNAIKEKLGVLLTLIDHVEVEALPTNLPEKLVIDITHLAAVDDQIVVGELAIPQNVTLLTDPTVIVVKIGAFIVEKEPEPIVPLESEAPTSEEEAPKTEEQSKETPQEEK